MSSSHLAASLLALTLVAAKPSVPPPTPVPPDGSPSPYPTALDTPPPSELEPRVAAASVVLADLDTGRVLYERASFEPRPIASLTKMMTALLVIERAAPEEPVLASTLAASQGGAELGLEPGETLPVRDLLLALLLQSANDAAVALAEHVGGSVEVFVELMNRRAAKLGLESTVFASPSGLDDRGYSTAADLAVLAGAAFRDPVFARVVATKFASIPAPDEEPRRIQNRNALLWLYPGALGGKTGFTGAAGFCLMAAAEREGLRLVTVVLGAPEQAYDAAAEILNHGFAAWERRTMLSFGQRVEPVRVGERPVPVEAGATLTVLAERGAPVELEIEPIPLLELPVQAGEVVATAVASTEGAVLGEAPLVATETVGAVAPSPDAPPAEAEPWWREAWEAATGVYLAVYHVLID